MINLTDKITLYNADNLEIMRGFMDNEFDLAIVDPPYGLGEKLIQGGTWSKKWQKKGVNWDVLPNIKYFNELFRVCNNWIIWGANYFVEYLPNCRCFIAWHKPYMDGMQTMSNVELALTSFDANAKKISINKDLRTDDRIHVTQKPVALYEWILANYAKEGDKILDTHLGSGSITIAIDKANTLDHKNFSFVGIEIDKEYFEASVARFNAYKKQLLLF